MTMEENNYWSIGEVLSLLQDDFPEVTISKIRFLESQGLIDPERTASGYRRFYRADIHRLEWILTQQRDHYLPLKVIRDRLDAGEWQPPPDPGTGLAPVIDMRTGLPGGGPAGSATGATTDSTNGDHDPADDDPAASDDASDERDDAVVTGDGDAPAGSDDGAEGPDAEATAEVDGPAAGAETTENDPGVDESSDGDGESSDGADAEADGEVGDAPAIDDGGPAAESGGTPATTHGALPTDVALTIDELADSSGCDVAMVRELERFGLVVGRPAGPTVLYDSDALMIARFAAQFRTYGLDPRHLRTFLVGAEREVALLAQVVEPLRHRRDPETRRKSAETMDDLSDLAASLRARLMRRIINEQLPPV